MSTTVVTNLAPRRPIVADRVSRQAVVSTRAAVGARGPQGSMLLGLTLRGTQIVGVGIIPLTLPFNAEILRFTANVGIAPTGQALIFDVLKNGISILTTVVLSIQPGETVAVPVVPDDTEFLIGDQLTVNVIQIGSISAGAYATVVAEVAQIE